MTPRIACRLGAILGLSLAAVLLLTPAAALAQEGQPPADQGFTYVVRPGDTWVGLANTFGVSVATLKANNPKALHPRGYLWVGDTLWIPVPRATPRAETGYWYTVRQGQTWNTVSRATGVSVAVLKQANPVAARDPQGWLYIGQLLWIPTGAPPPAATAEASPTSSPTLPVATATSAATATLAPTTAVPATPVPPPVATATPTVPATAAPTRETVVVAPTALPTATPLPTATARPGPAPACQRDAAAYPTAIAAYLNAPGSNPTGLKDWLTGCEMIGTESGAVAEFTPPGALASDVVAVLAPSAAADEESHGLLLVYHKLPAGYALSHKVEGAGTLALLRAEDINADGKPDLVYVDSSCGAHTCYSTLFVESWNGTAFQDWIKGEPTMASAEYSFADTILAGQGKEIIAHGGVINSAGAGPQRAWTETYISPEGGPYELYKKAYDSSSCLYFQVLDANELFAQWGTSGFGPAIAAYEKAIADTSATACGTIPNELNTLRDYARFRLIVSLVARGRADRVSAIKAQMTYKPLVGAAEAFLQSLNTSHSIVQACRDATRYATANPDSWKFLADWGYANPSFTAKDLCPLG